MKYIPALTFSAIHIITAISSTIKIQYLDKIKRLTNRNKTVLFIMKIRLEDSQVNVQIVLEMIMWKKLISSTNKALTSKMFTKLCNSNNSERKQYSILLSEKMISNNEIRQMEKILSQHVFGDTWFSLNDMFLKNACFKICDAIADQFSTNQNYHIIDSAEVHDLMRYNLYQLKLSCTQQDLEIYSRINIQLGLPASSSLQYPHQHQLLIKSAPLRRRINIGWIIAIILFAISLFVNLFGFNR